MTDLCGEFESRDCGSGNPCVSTYLDNCPQDVDCQTVIQALVAKCSTCNDTYAFEMRVRTVVSRRCNDPVPDALKFRISQAIQQAQRRR
jgi:Tfp pilus assembly protein PilX